MSYERISRALLWAAAHYQEQPSLEALAAQAAMSPTHFQRVFQRLVGVSPKAYIQHLSARQAAASLRHGRGVLQSSLDAGLSGPGRLHDLIIKVEGVSPGELALGGHGLTLKTATLPTPFGRLFAALAPRGLVYAGFEGTDEVPNKIQLKQRWPKARLTPDPAAVSKALKPFWKGQGEARVWSPGTSFQLQVWRALVRVPQGQKLSYSSLTQRAGLKGVRAVASAVAANPVALLIPCHRVIQASGAVGDYHWGSERKRALLAYEAAESIQR